MMIFPCETPLLLRSDAPPAEERNVDDFERVQIPRCTMPVPCGVCWYCLQFTKAERP